MTFELEVNWNVVGSMLIYWRGRLVFTILVLLSWLSMQCLHNAPRERPNTDELLARLQRMKVEVEGEYGGPVR